MTRAPNLRNPGRNISRPTALGQRILFSIDIAIAVQKNAAVQSTLALTGPCMHIVDAALSANSVAKHKNPFSATRCPLSFALLFSTCAIKLVHGLNRVVTVPLCLPRTHDCDDSPAKKLHSCVAALLIILNQLQKVAQTMAKVCSMLHFCSDLSSVLSVNRPTALLHSMLPEVLMPAHMK